MNQTASFSENDLPPVANVLPINFNAAGPASVSSPKAAPAASAPEAAVPPTTNDKVAIANRDHFIILPSGDMSFSEAATAIFSKIAATRKLFFRAGRIVRPVQDAEGRNLLEAVQPTAFRSILENFGALFAWRAGESGPVLKPVRCSEDTARALMSCDAARELLPYVNVISPCPILAKGPDGEIKLLGPGWHDHQGGTFVAGNVMPAQVEYKEAVAALSELISDFDFATPGDRARALASLLTPALKFGGWLNRLTPLDVGEADQSQSGKTYRQEMVAAIYGMLPYCTGKKDGGVGSLDESLQSAILAGHTFILIDNVRGNLNSEFLERVLTNPKVVPCRVPHKGEVVVDASNLLFQLTSNLAQMTRDAANRSSIVRNRKRPIDYKFKSFNGLDAKSHVQANQGYYLGCVFALIEEWCANDNPRSDVRTGNAFAEWASVLDWFTQNVFSAGELMAGMKDAADRVCDPKKSWVRNVGIALKVKGKHGEKLGSAVLAEFSIDNETMPPGVRPDADEMSVARKIGSIFGGMFSDSINVIEVDGIKVTRVLVWNSTDGRNDKRYIFSAA